MLFLLGIYFSQQIKCVALFPGLAQLSVTYSMKKRPHAGRAGNKAIKWTHSLNIYTQHAVNWISSPDPLDVEQPSVRGEVKRRSAGIIAHISYPGM